MEIKNNSFDEENKNIIDTEVTDADFANWDTIMRERLIEKLKSHVAEVTNRNSETKDPQEEALIDEIHKEYDEELDALKSGGKAIRKNPAIDMFASIFQQMVREKSASFGPDMKNYFEFQKRFFEESKEK